MKKNRTIIYADGASLDQIKKIDPLVKGYTFNPSLFRKLGVKNYLSFSKILSKKIKKKSISLEVFADDEINMIHQAKKLSNLGNNIYVKIPITFTNGKSTKNVIKELIKLNVKLNITAIFTLKQVKKILPIVKNTKTILSIFAGRIYDTGIDANKIMQSICKLVHKNSKCLVLWASPRMIYDLIQANKMNCDIITLPVDLIFKKKNFGKKLESYSLETVKNFYQDSLKSKYKL
jgi:transaldolase